MALLTVHVNAQHETRIQGHSDFEYLYMYLVKG